MKDLQALYNLVEKCLEKLDVIPAEARAQEEGQWTLKRGNATVWIDLFYIEEEEESYFQVLAPVVTIPDEEAKKNALYEDLLRLNYSLYGIAFSIFEDGVYLKFIRETEGLDESEILHSIRRCGNYADALNDTFVKKFGGRRIE